MNVATWSTYDEDENERKLYGNKKVEKRMRLTKEASIVSHKSLIKTTEKSKESSNLQKVQDEVIEEHDDHSCSSFEDDN